MPKIVPNQFPTNLPPDGKVKAAFIGEAPGRDEETTGLPFMGAAGREFDRWLRPFFIRSQCFVGNLCQERPPDNKLENYFVDSKNTIPNEKLRGWIGVLKEQLEKIRPNIIVALGRHPTYILTGKDFITKQWGSVLPCTLVPGLKVIANLHPSYIQRGMFDLRPLVRAWMKRAKDQSLSPEYRPPQRNLVVDPPLETVLFELDRLMGAKELASDIETVPGKRARFVQGKAILTPDIISCIAFSDSPDWSISIPFSRAGGQHRWSVDIEMEIWSRVSRLLGQEGPLKIFHNLMFDFLELGGHRVMVAPPRYDTMAAHNRAYPDLTKKKLKKLKLNRLAFCTALYTEEPFYKDDHKDDNIGDDWRGADVEFWRYNNKDAAVLHEIKAATMKDLKEMNVYHLFERDMRVFAPLAAMGLQGVKRDVEKVQGLNEYVTGRVEVLQAALDIEVGHSINTKSSPQMQKLLYTELQLPFQYEKDTGKPTADEGAIAKLYQKTNLPILKSITELTRLRGFKSNYLDAAIGEDRRTRTTYNQSKTSTFRISSSDAILGEGKNLQTIPRRERPGEDDYNRMIKEFKQTFIADEGMMMWQRDYSQAEAMVVAWMAEDLQQIHDFSNGLDIHCRTVEILYGVTYEEALNGYLNKDQVWVNRRDNIAKPVRHGFNYLLGKNTLHQAFAKEGMNVETKECRRLLQAMASNVPAVRRWHHEVEAVLRDNRTIVNAFGRKRKFLGMIDNDTIREAVAYGPQSTVGDLLNFALERIYYTSGIMDEMDLLLQIHDAAIGQSPFDKVKEHTDVAGELMTIPLTIKSRELIIPSDLKVGLNWGELKKPEWIQ